jgi:alkylation response protein AidB-like acyl-CoA dehydrogenase
LKRILTPRQREIVELAGGLADVFAERAQRWDRENAFPFSNYDDLRESGYLRGTVPQDLGGGGWSLGELVLAQERLAMGDGATALAVNMHVSPIGQWASIWHDTGDERLEEMLRGVAAGEVIWASLTSERGVQNTMSDSSTIAAKVDGGWRVDGHKIFATNSAIATHFSFSARYEDPERGPRLMIFRTPKDAPGFTFVENWDMLGMRATQSNDLKIEGVFVPDDALIHSLPVGHLDARVLKTQFVWALATFGAVYLGIAAGALDWTRDVVRKRKRHENPHVQASIAEAEMLLETARSVLDLHCANADSGLIYEQLTVQEGMARCAFAKVVACSNAVAIMHHLIDAVGGAFYGRSQPFERWFRDVQAGVIMPATRHQALALVGATSLGVEFAPAIDFDETGVDSRPKTPAAAS